MEIDSLAIKILLAERGMTQAALANTCGIAAQNISGILLKKRCSPLTVGKIASAFGVPVSQIIRRDDRG